MFRRRSSLVVRNVYQAAFDLGTGVAEAAFADASASPADALPEWTLLSARAGRLAQNLFPDDANEETRRLVVSLARCGARIRWQRLAPSLDAKIGGGPLM
jgi:hypothetical protein